MHDVIAESRYDSQVELRVSRMLSAPGAGAAVAAAAAAGMPGIGGHPIRGGPVTSRSLAVPTGTRIQVGETLLYYASSIVCIASAGLHISSPCSGAERIATLQQTDLSDKFLNCYQTYYKT